MKGINANFVRICVLAGVLVCLVFAPAELKAQSSGDEVIGEVLYYTFKPGDTLPKVARRFDVGIEAIRNANKDKRSARDFRAGRTVILPTAHVLPQTRHEGIVINLAEPRLYLFSSGAEPKSFPVGIGKQGWETPRGETFIARKRPNPTWIPTPALREEDPTLPLSIPPGPDNPLGDFALSLGWPGFAIHGTNMPETIGRRLSHGCIRMYPEDIETLFNAVEKGTRVTVIDAPYKLGWEGNTLFLEIPPRRYAVSKQHVILSATEVREALRRKAGSAPIIWEAVERALKSRDGIPVPVVNAKSAYLTSRAIEMNEIAGENHE